MPFLTPGVGMRRGKTSGKAVKKRPRRATRSRRSVRSAVRNGERSVADLRAQVAALTSELDGARERQTAASEVLQAISRSQGDLEPVFRTILENATRICECEFGTVLSFDGQAFRNVAIHNVPRAFVEREKGAPIVPLANAPLERLRQTKRPVHVADLKAEQAYEAGFKPLRMLVDSGGARSLLLVPMLKDGTLVGVISGYRKEVRIFSDKQIELLENFAAQAVIAIENTRLLSELRQRTDDLSESLEQQTATSEVLKVISSSPGELEPVFQSMLENAVRICEAKFATLWRVENGTARMASILHINPELAEFLRRGEHKPGPLHPMSRVIKFRQTLHIADFRTDPSYLERDPVAVAGVELGGIRTLVVVPMLKDGDLVGAIAIFRQEVRPFTDKQIELVQELRRQAVIAIENTRLLSELREFAAAADRHRRRAQGDQPLDVRLAGGAEHAGRIGSAVM